MLKQHTLDITAFSAVQAWLIDPEVRDMLLGQLIDKGQIVLSYEEDPIHYTDYNWAYYQEACKKGSIAVMSIKGVIYDYYADYLVNKLSLMYADKNLSGLFVKMNSPGGSGDAGYKIGDTLMNAPFETHCHIDYGQASSAGYLIANSCDSISASRANDRVGSIGAYLSYQNWSKYYERNGVVSKDIYATQSTEKNQESREAEKGNFKLLEAYVSQQAQAFIDCVKERRPSLNTATMDPFKGKVFSATDALTIGLIDSVCSQKDALKLVKSTTPNTNVTPRTNMILGYVKMAALLAIKGVEASALSEDQLKAANAELTAEGIDNVVLISKTEYELAVKAMNSQSGDSTALTTAKADVTRLTTELATAKTDLTTANTALATAQTEITRLGGMNGAEHTTVNNQSEAQADQGSDDTTKLIDSLEHNLAVPEWLRNLPVSK